MERRDMASGIFIGEGTLLVRCAEIFLNRGHEILGVISSEPLVIRWAEERGIRRAGPDDDAVEFLGAQPFDYLFSVANLKMLPAELVALPRKLAINFHDALLPKYAGLYATSWALMHQETTHGVTWHETEGDARPATHGVTWHEMTDPVDSGRILKQRSFDVSEDETALSLNAKCYEAGIQAFAELTDDISADALTFQDPRLAERTYFSKWKRPGAACTVAWERPAEELGALARALTFGAYQNPLGLPKVSLGREAILAPEIVVLGASSGAVPGTVVGIDADAIRVATGSKDVALRGLRTIDGEPLSIAELAARFDLREGSHLAGIDPTERERLTAVNGRLCRHEDFWVRRLATLDSVELPYANRSAGPTGEARHEDAPMAVSAEVAAVAARLGDGWDASDVMVAAFAIYLARLGGKDRFDLGFGEPRSREELAGLEGFFATRVPLRIELGDQASAADGLRAVRDDLLTVRERTTYVRDVAARHPELKALLARGGRPTYPIAVEIGGADGGRERQPGAELTLLVAPDGSECLWVYDSSVYSADSVAAMQRQLGRVLRDLAAEPDRPLAELSLLDDDERSRVLFRWNDTGVDYPRGACVHQLFEAQAARTPDAVAMVFEGDEISYRELDARANRLARHLGALGVGPESLVGICLERSLDLAVGLLGILKAGGAYVPLDPTYPRERLQHMVEDSALRVLVTQDSLVDRLPEHDARVVRLDRDREAIARESADRVDAGATPDNLAYVIYTSGSTGKPKGVMVGHRNVVNFFAGMDERLAHEPPGTWLAVTSLSFDISVLELFWTLARGFKVVLASEQAKVGSSSGGRGRLASKSIEFSLFYFASDEGERAADKYELLIEGAKFGDRHGFSAVWTPERHFHAFGGLYPNPAVASAAIAAVTERIQIRAGSCVLPLHSPIRVAEEWSLVDNLSKGRVGISFAAGWQPNDFAIAPEKFADRKDGMFRDIETVRRLWRGETIAFPGPTGKDVGVRTLPRPIQPELPIWITAAGSPETFRMAGRLGAGLLTHLLGQSVEELAEKLAIYRSAWREAGHAGEGHVTLMLHTFVGDDDDAVREVVREPMKQYLRSSVDLIKKAAWSFPAFKNQAALNGANPAETLDLGDLSEEEMAALLDHSFERYFKTSGLFGTPETCLEMVDKLKAIDVDEIACLIDFGVESPVVLEHLPRLAAVKDLSNPVATPDAGDYSIPAQIARHGVTHLQCTPSMASMLLLDEPTAAALRPLKNVMIGGEAFPVQLARQLKELVSGDVINMYGPTETTIWSSTYRLDGADGPVPIGRPIANTQLYILDRGLQPVPVGVPGELFIGGEGVVRGYLNRPELTDERFVRDPFSGQPGARMYRTGDLARWRADGNVEFLGRIDHQVKIRGYRIELGEIEALLNEHPTVREAVVVAREDQPGDKRLVGYVLADGHGPISVGQLRDHLKEKLPEFMVPSHLVELEAFPLTPNAKVDRKALPAPDQVEVGRETQFVAPENDLESKIATVWQQALNVAKVGTNDNFFELGGHSLLMVQVQHRLRSALERDLSITDLFRFPTIQSLAAHLGRDADDGATVQQAVERADARRGMMMRRRQLRQMAVR